MPEFRYVRLSSSASSSLQDQSALLLYRCERLRDGASCHVRRSPTDKSIWETRVIGGNGDWLRADEASRASRRGAVLAHFKHFADPFTGDARAP